MNKILTIVVPAYNVEKYLKRCIDSCLDQDIPKENYEIIIVNDGSTDNTLRIANELSNHQSNVKVIDQANTGSGGARNTGLKEAQGKYIWFIDSDDYIEKNVLHDLISQAEKHKLDALFFWLRRVCEVEFSSQNDETHFDCCQLSIPENIVMTGRQAVIQGYYPCSACCILLKRDFLIRNQLYFVSELYLEDVEFSYRLTCRAEKVMFIQTAPYNYFTHSGSKTSYQSIDSLKQKQGNDVDIAVSFMNLSKEYKADAELYSVIIKRAKGILFSLLWQAWRNRKTWSHNGITKALIEKMENEGLYPLKAPFRNFKQAVIILLILNHKIFL